MSNMSRTRTVVTAGILGLAAISVGLAQGGRGGTPPPAPPRMLVQITHVKPDMASAYETLIKNELLPAAKKGGQPFRWTFTNGPIGGSGFTYTAVTPVADFGIFDQPSGPVARRAMGEAAWTAYQTKLRSMVVSTESSLATLRQDLTIAGGSPTPPPLAVVTILQVAPGKGDEFTRIMTTDYLPNYRKAGVKDFATYAISFGDVPQGRVVTVRGISKYTDLEGDGLLRRAGLSAEAAAQVNARRAAVATGVSNVVQRYIPEMSFGSAPTRPPSQ